VAQIDWPFLSRRSPHDLAMPVDVDVAGQGKESAMSTLNRFLTNDDGVTSIEYALIASLIAVFIIAALQLVGTNLSTVFTEVGNSLK
jgi:pilus assembly protein Flp/PilA